MRGRTVPLSRARKMVGELLHFAAGVPTVPVQRRMNLAPVAAARRACTERPSWTVLFSKAFSLVAVEFPQLRQAYCKFPLPHLYEYPSSVAHVAVERLYEGEPTVFGLLVKDIEHKSLSQIAALVQRARAAPLDEIVCFRRALRTAGWPRPVRRVAWWFGLNLGRQRANYFGTFAVTVYSGLGAESLHPLTPLTTSLNYGVIAPDGTVDVRLIYDHRVLDGATVARALARLEHVLNTTIRSEIATTAVPLPLDGPDHAAA